MPSQYRLVRTEPIEASAYQLSRYVGGLLFRLDPVHEELRERSSGLPDVLRPLLDQPRFDQGVELRRLLSISPGYVWWRGALPGLGLGDDRPFIAEPVG